MQQVFSIIENHSRRSAIEMSSGRRGGIVGVLILPRLPASQSVGLCHNALPLYSSVKFLNFRELSFPFLDLEVKRDKIRVTRENCGRIPGNPTVGLTDSYW